MLAIQVGQTRCQFWCQLVLLMGSLACVVLRGGKATEAAWILGFLAILPLPVKRCATMQNGLVGITQSTVVSAVDHAGQSLEDAIRWLESELQKFFDSSQQLTFPFGGYAYYLLRELKQDCSSA
jgi:hypothetical protein